MPERQCFGCTSQSEWGCKAFKFGTGERGADDWYQPAHIPLEYDGEDDFSCPRQFIHRNPVTFNRIVMLYGFYQKGHLPDRGAIVDQSNVLMEAFRVMDEANSEADAQLAEEAANRRSGYG